MPKLMSNQFTKGECEATVDMSRCPQCCELVAGPSQQVVAKASSAADLEHHFEDMVLSTT